MKKASQRWFWFSFPAVGLLPIVLWSCAAQNNPAQKPPTPDQPGTGTDKPDNGSQKPPANNPDETNPEDLVFIDPNKNPELFQSAHLFDLETIQKAQSTTQILQNTSEFKSSLNNLMWLLKNYNGQGIDFISTPNDQQMLEAFYKALENIGIFGDYQFNNPEDLVKFSPNLFIDKYLTQPKHLATDLKDFTNKDDIRLIASVNLETILQKNVFGFLPSNLSQLLYYLNFVEISNLFEIPDVIRIAAQFNDERGTIEIFFEDKSNQTYQMNYDQTNLTALKKTSDFQQFIFDRSFNIRGNFWQYEDRSPFSREGYKFSVKNVIGTAWVLDRLKNEALAAKNQYEFLVATNIHVVDLSPYFEKVGSVLDPNYGENWNGGFYDKDDQVTTKSVITGNKTRNYDILTKSANNAMAALEFGYFEERDYQKVENDPSSFNKRKWTNSLNINAQNYLDLLWYTPTFNSENVRTLSSGDNEYFFGQENQRFGSLFNGGIDFAIVKVVLTAEQVQKLLPTLAPLLGQTNEKDWYVGLGTDQLVSPSDSFFAGGFSGGNWKSLESVGGRITTKARHIEKQNLTQKYWKKYDQTENEQMNKFNFRKDWYTNQQRPDLEHGMAIEHVLQNSVLNIKSKNDQYLKGGASGSMVINSRFEAVGIVYNMVLPPGSVNPDDVISNSVALFKHHSQFNNWSGSILQDVQANLQTENLQTIKLNP